MIKRIYRGIVEYEPCSYDYSVLPDLGPNLGEAYGRGKYAGGSTRKLLGV